jgi:hypothetical protein
MTNHEFDSALVASAFALAARSGWRSVTVVGAAREAGLKLERARERFPGKGAILMRFGQIADEHALADALESGPVRERLFDLVMRRFDALQTHRQGVLALLRDLPADPATGLLLTAETGGSMAWMLGAAGVATAGVRGAVAVQAMVGVWLYALRAWQKDESADLSGTMAALDRALTRVEQAAHWLGHGKQGESDSGPKPFPETPLDPAPTAADSIGPTLGGGGDALPPEANAI